jgi:hypothetical protein
MAESKLDTIKPDLNLAAVCGLFCQACSIYIGTMEDPRRLEAIAARWGLPADQVHCEGCRSQRRFAYCQTCKMSACAREKGLDFCGACPDYPCPDLAKFQAEMPHRLELWSNQERIRQVGFEKWYEEMLDHYACPECRTINSTYDPVCRKCGASPGSEYVARHGETIKTWLTRGKS